VYDVGFKFGLKVARQFQRLHNNGCGQGGKGYVDVHMCLSVNSVKDSVYLPPIPMSLKELCDRITNALQTITADMLHRVWDEFDYRVDVCRVTQGAHIEGL
jgi:hypothetical protein